MKNLHYTPGDVRPLETLSDRQKANKLRDDIYKILYPGVIDPGTDIYDFKSILWGLKNDAGNIVATARLAYDDPECGLPSERYLSTYLTPLRNKGLTLAEYGRFINTEEGQAKKELTKAFYARLFFHAICDGIDIVLIVAPAHKKTLYLDRFGASLLCADIVEDFGSGTPFAAYAWDLRNTKAEFFRWCWNRGPAETGIASPPGLCNDVNRWNGYASSFSSFTTLYQARLYRAVALLLAGHVVDFGSGPAKLAPYLTGNNAIVTYTGIDSSPEMVAISSNMLKTLNDRRFKTICSSIEDLDITGFNSGVSINSYYAWTEPATVLKKIGSTLIQGANFILATPNPNLDMDRLMDESNKEFILQREFIDFKTWNKSFAQEYRRSFVPMDDLIEQLRSAGFKIVTCHTEFYEGGINFVHAQKA